MDPNTALAQIREAIAEGDHELASELFDGLDQWLSRGGFLPKPWVWSR